MTARQPRDITLAEIEQSFELASYWFGEKWCPAVHRTSYRGVHGYAIRVLKSCTVSGDSERLIFDEFELDATGGVATAPRGYAKVFKPGRVVDIEAAAARYEAPQADARRIL
jgi:hypothetical protein